MADKKNLCFHNKVLYAHLTHRVVVIIGIPKLNLGIVYRIIIIVIHNQYSLNGNKGNSFLLPCPFKNRHNRLQLVGAETCTFSVLIYIRYERFV